MSSTSEQRFDASCNEGVAACDAGRVLIVDDEPNILKLFKTLISISLTDIDVDLAVNGADAVDRFDEFHEAVILMDMHMPVMTGQRAFQKIEQMCREKKWAMPTVIFCTGYAPPEAVRRIVGNESRHRLLQKPVSAEQLVENVKEAFLR